MHGRTPIMIDLASDDFEEECNCIRSDRNASSTTKAIDLSVDDSTCETDADIAWRAQIMEFRGNCNTRNMSLPMKDESIVLYSPTSMPETSPSIRTLLVQQSQEQQWKEVKERLKREREDAEFAATLQFMEEEKPVCSPTPVTSPSSTLIASEIAKLYSGDGEVFPNIHELFVHFDKCYFSGTLNYVVVKWSYKMKLCAGVCEFKSVGRLYEVEIRLSEPLLKFRPLSDLIDTLLHEMIHAFLLIKHRRADRDDHGPLFQEQMHRLNNIAGTHITIYHSFFDEVNYYRDHWWKCGKCARVEKRSANRAPSKYDNWWASHQQQCGGSFIKIKEPNGYKARNKRKTQTKTTPSSNQPDLKKFFPGLGKRIRSPSARSNAKRQNTNKYPM